MNWLKTIIQEVIGLFIDDGSFALAIIVWLGLVGLVSWQLPAARPWCGAGLFAGLAMILAESTLRRARK